jgi:exopolysaccharide production protein ExoQ
MPPPIASCIFAAGVLALFFLDRNDAARSSKALWIPVLWLLLAGSRPASVWLGMAPASGDTNLDGSPFDRLVFLTLVVTALVAVVSRGRRVMPLLKSNWPIMAFFGYCAISIFWSDYPEVAFKRWTKSVGELAMVFVVLSEIDPLTGLKRLLNRVGFVLLPVSILLIRYYPSLGRAYGAGESVSDPWSVMYTGVTQTKNFLGLITLIFGLGAVWRLSELYTDRKNSRRTRQSIAQGALLCSAIYLFAVAQSATSLSCFIIGSTIIFVTASPSLSRKRILVHALVVTLVVLPLIALFLSTGANLLGVVGRDQTLTGRTEIWLEVLKIAPNPIVGTGFESFWLGPRLQDIWARHWWHPNEAHNGYIEVYLNLGWVGLAMLGVLFVTGYRNSIECLRRTPVLGRFNLSFFVVTVVYSLTESAIRTLNPLWFFFLLSVAAIPVAVSQTSPSTAFRTVMFNSSLPKTTQLHRFGPPKGRL